MRPLVGARDAVSAPPLPEACGNTRPPKEGAHTQRKATAFSEQSSQLLLLDSPLNGRQYNECTAVRRCHSPHPQPTFLRVRVLLISAATGGY